MKTLTRCGILATMIAAATVTAAPVRVVVLGFDDETGMKSDPLLGGLVNTGTLADKGIYLLAQRMLGVEGFTVVDRRDYMNQMKKLAQSDEGKPSPMKPGYLDTARALDADVLLRGSLLSFSTGKEVVDQGGHHVEFAKASLSVAVQAQSVMDGAVIAVATGRAEKSIRQTANLKTVFSENDILDLLGEALSDAAPKVAQGIQEKLDELAKQPKVAVSIDSTANPALVEIDGVLMGSTPIQNLMVYKGDHVFHVSRPGYESITKRIHLDRDVKIMVPMLRRDLTPEERVKILESSDLRHYTINGEPQMMVLEVED